MPITRRMSVSGAVWPGIAGRYGRSELAGGDVGQVDPGHHVGDGGGDLAGRAADDLKRDAGVGVDGDRLLVDRPRGGLRVGLLVIHEPQLARASGEGERGLAVNGAVSYTHLRAHETRH